MDLLDTAHKAMNPLKRWPFGEALGLPTRAELAEKKREERQKQQQPLGAFEVFRCLHISIFYHIVLYYIIGNIFYYYCYYYFYFIVIIIIVMMKTQSS